MTVTPTTDLFSSLVLDDDEIRRIAGLGEGVLLRRYRKHYLYEPFQTPDGQTHGTFDSCFMPVSGFPTVSGRVLRGPAEYVAGPTPQAHAFEVCLVGLRNTDPPVLNLTVGPLVVSLRSSSTGIDVDLPGVSVARSLPIHAPIRIGLRLMQGAWWLAVNANHIAEVQSALADFQSVPAFEISVRTGTIALLQYQYITESGGQFVEFSHADTTGVTLVAPANPTYIHMFESNMLWRLRVALGRAILYRVSLVELSSRPEALQEHEWLQCFLLQTLAAVCAWPQWRPSQGSDPSTTDWERGNWANGFVPAVVGIILAALGSSLPAPQRLAASQQLRVKGTSWMMPGASGTPSNREFPGVAHWLRRSTNHGIVILASAWTGAALGLGPDSEEAQYFETQLWTLLPAAFPDGSFLEGVGYAEFSLMECLLAFWMQARLRGQSFPRFLERRAPWLAGVKEWFCRASDPAGMKLGAFGDCRRAPWQNASLSLLGACPGGPDLRGASPWRKTHRLVQITHSNYSASLAPLAALLEKRAVSCEPGEPTGLKAYPDSQVAHLRCRTQPGDDFQLWVFGSKLHRTHNWSHDCCTFVAQRNGVTLPDRRFGSGYQAAFSHSGLGVRGAACLPGTGPYDCVGCVDEEGRMVPRGISGRLDGCIDRGHSFVLSATARSMQDAHVVADPRLGTVVQEFSRAWLVSSDGAMIVIVSVVRKAGPGNVFFNFHVPSSLEVPAIADESVHRVEVPGGVTFDFLSDSDCACAGLAVRRRRVVGGDPETTRLIDEVASEAAPHGGKSLTVTAVALLTDARQRIVVESAVRSGVRTLRFGDGVGRQLEVGVVQQSALRFTEPRFVIEEGRVRNWYAFTAAPSR